MNINFSFSKLKTATLHYGIILVSGLYHFKSAAVCKSILHYTFDQVFQTMLQSIDVNFKVSNKNENLVFQTQQHVKVSGVLFPFCLVNGNEMMISVLFYFAVL